jgi:hypothetical protein
VPRLTPLPTIAVACAIASLSAAAAEPAVELKVGTTAHRGRVWAKDSQSCWLMQNDGSLAEVPLDRVTSFRKEGDFRAASTAVLGDQLAREFGREYEVAKTREYVVVGPRGRARAYANLFDETFRTFQLYFRVRNFDVPSPEFPLIAIVYATRAEFDERCRREGVPSAGFAGFYLGESNRILMYEADLATSEIRNPKLEIRNKFEARRLETGIDEFGPAFDVVGGVGTRTESLLIHEATHQLAYNCGLHGRLGWNPKWTVEGLATVFEAPGIRNRSASRSRDDRINPGRLRDFQEYAKSRRKPGAIAEIVADDRKLQTAVSDFYAEAWALTFFLVETRPREYAGYMRKIAEREPFQRYTAEERLADFRKAFGGNLELLDAEFVRFTAKLE